MPNTRGAAKRDRQSSKRQTVNRARKGATRKAVKKAVQAIEAKNSSEGPAVFKSAIKALSRAASRGVIPARRASRKISRLVHYAKKTFPEILASK